MKPVGPADERRHRPGDDPWWNERFVFDAWTTEGGLGATASLTLLPNRRRAWYWAAVVGVDRSLVSLVDLEVIPPSRGLQIRAEGLWADHICEEPLVSWTLANEGFAVALDDPGEALLAARGVSTPLAFDLGFEADRPVEAGDRAYRQECEVHGDIAVGPERLVFDGRGVRRHLWGTDRWWERLTDAPRRGGLRAPVLLVVEEQRYELERVLGRADGSSATESGRDVWGWGEWVGHHDRS